jgi:hypothetical protein
MDLPEWDQWDAEGLHLLAPWFQGHSILKEVFLPHNEHRVVLTKLTNLGLTLANGQWDQRLETVVNALIAGLIAAGVFAWGSSFLGRRWLAPLFVLLAAAYGLPFAAENVINGFHSQQLFMVGFSFGAIAGLVGSRLGSVGWWLGLACLGLAMLTMASGFFAAAVVVGFLLFRLMRRQVRWKEALPALVPAAVLVAVGALTQVSVPYHEGAKAHTVFEFTATLVQGLEWPAAGLDYSWLSVFLWIPWVWVVVRMLRSEEGDGRNAGWGLACLGGWVVLQLLATAYARGNGGNGPPSRYIDTLIVGAVVNALSVGWLAGYGGLNGSERGAHLAIALLWLVTIVGGARAQLTAIYNEQLPEAKRYRYYCIENVRNYLATGDEAYVRHDEIPYPGTAGFLYHLHERPLQDLLPASVRIPLPLAEARASGSFVRGDSRMKEADRSLLRPASAAPGIPKECPAPSNAVYWGSFGPGGGSDAGVWESAALPAPHAGYLKFEMAGQPGANGARLELKDAASGQILGEVRPDRTPGNSWRSAYVRSPASPFVVEAHDVDPNGWIAFTQPVEMGTLSYWAWRCVKNGLLLAELSAGAALVLLAIYTFRP